MKKKLFACVLVLVLGALFVAWRYGFLFPTQRACQEVGSAYEKYAAVVYRSPASGLPSEAYTQELEEARNELGQKASWALRLDVSYKAKDALNDVLSVVGAAEKLDRVEGAVARLAQTCRGAGYPVRMPASPQT